MEGFPERSLKNLLEGFLEGLLLGYPVGSLEGLPWDSMLESMTEELVEAQIPHHFDGQTGLNSKPLPHLLTTRFQPLFAVLFAVIAPVPLSSIGISEAKLSRTAAQAVPDTQEADTRSTRPFASSTLH